MPELVASPPEAHCAKPLRADAERNRRLILEVGARVFAERGLDATLNDIAKEAGVGVGTVYRKFPDKEALIEVLASEKLAELRHLMTEAEALSDPRESIRYYLLGIADARACDRGLMKAIMQSDHIAPDFRIGKAAIRSRIEEMIQRAAAEPGSSVRFAAADIEMFMIMVGAVADRTRESDPEGWRPYAEVLLDGFGLCPEAPASAARSTSNS